MTRLRDPRPFETERELVREKMCVQRVCAIYQELKTLTLDPRVKKLLLEVESLHFDLQMHEEHHILTIAGQLCMQAGQPELWRQIFTAAMDGNVVDPDDELRFLDHNFDAQ
jgi:hypothetical protein